MWNQLDVLKTAVAELKRIDVEAIVPKSVLNGSAEEALLFELKGLADDLRTSIWFRVQCIGQSSEQTKGITERLKMYRAAQLWRQLNTNGQPNAASRPGEYCQPKNMSGLASIERAAETAVQRHFEGVS